MPEGAAHDRCLCIIARELLRWRAHTFLCVCVCVCVCVYISDDEVGGRRGVDWNTRCHEWGGTEARGFVRTGLGVGVSLQHGQDELLRWGVGVAKVEGVLLWLPLL